MHIQLDLLLYLPLRGSIGNCMYLAYRLREARLPSVQAMSSAFQRCLILLIGIVAMKNKALKRQSHRQRIMGCLPGD